MKILYIGDIFGHKGIEAVRLFLSDLKKQNSIDLVIANAENVTNGKSLSWQDYNTLKSLGIDYFSMGNHTWSHPDIYDILTKQKDIVRPYNVVDKFNGHGKGTITFSCLDKSIRLTNLIGKSIPKFSDSPNPFLTMDYILDNADPTDIHIVDFHAEASGEKNALAEYLDGRVSIVVGTHTHVQTADERILKKGTAFITDLGMTGSYEGIIGAKKEPIITKHINDGPFKLEVDNGKCQISAVLFEIDNKYNQVINIQRFLIREK